jgi:hypothetical protein
MTIFLWLCEEAWAANEKWNLDNESRLDLELKKTREKRDLFGCSQKLPNACWITLNNPELIMRNLAVPPVCEITLLLKLRLYIKSILYLTVNTVLLHYKDQWVETVKENNGCLLWISQATHKYTVWEEEHFKYYSRETLGFKALLLFKLIYLLVAFTYKTNATPYWEEQL